VDEVVERVHGGVRDVPVRVDALHQFVNSIFEVVLVRRLMSLFFLDNLALVSAFFTNFFTFVTFFCSVSARLG
jgi:hypothetical protein